MKKKKWVLMLALSLIFALAFAFVIIRGFVAPTAGGADAEETVVQVQKVKKEKLTENILLTGKIVPDDEQKIYKNPENGEIVEFKVKENDKVKKGDPLFVYDAKQIEREYHAAAANRDRMKQQVAMLEKQINELSQQIEAVNKLGNASNGENGLEMVDAWQSELRQLEMEKSQLVMELESVRAETGIIQAEINELDEKKKALTVTSSIDGTVVKVNKTASQNDAGMEEPVIHIVSNKPFKVIGTMSEYDAVKIKPDQLVVIRPKVYKDREWKGKVESVSSYPSDDSGGEMDMFADGEMNVTMYPFTVAIEDDTKDLRQGFHVTLEVDVSGTEEALVIPHSAILDAFMLGMHEEETDLVDELMGFGGGFVDEEQQYVYVLVDGKLELREIETGKMSDQYVEILSGIELDELVVINPTDKMHDGMEVAEYDQVD